MTHALVPPGFEPPRSLETGRFALEPLTPAHNEGDHAAWTSSIEHIHATPGYDDDPSNGSPWPMPMSLEENHRDLERHERDFLERTGFTYTVLDPATRDVIGCVYIYPSVDHQHDARVRSWVRASHAELDRELWAVISKWLASDAWPFERPAYAPRT